LELDHLETPAKPVNTATHRGITYVSILQLNRKIPTSTISVATQQLFNLELSILTRSQKVSISPLLLHFFVLVSRYTDRSHVTLRRDRKSVCSESEVSDISECSSPLLWDSKSLLLQPALIRSTLSRHLVHIMLSL
jgi:hypothetical protein